MFSAMNEAPRDFYDVVMCTSVLEHIPHPIETLKEALLVTRPGGIVYMTVPNFDSWVARSQAERMRPLKAPCHCNFFAPRDLAHLCRKAGATSYRVRSYGMPMAWDFWRKHRLKPTTAAPTPKRKSPPTVTWKHRFVVKVYYWAGRWRGDKLELRVKKPT